VTTNGLNVNFVDFILRQSLPTDLTWFFATDDLRVTARAEAKASNPFRKPGEGGIHIRQ